jgi:ATP-dependent helicase/nuclease subunit B
MKTIISNTINGATKGILDAVRQRLAYGEECTILTTDRNVANMERIVLDTLIGVGAEFKVKVMSFTRFAVQTLGDSVRDCLTPEGSVMLLADVIEKINGDFVYYRRVRPDSLAGEVYAALTALRNSGVSTEEFDQKADKLSTSLKNKAHDLALMHRGYMEALQDKRHDSSTRLETLAKYLSDTEDKMVKGVNYFVVDMQDFNQPQLEVLRALDKNAKSLTVGLVSGFDNKNRRIYPDDTINKIRGLSSNRVVEVVELDNLNPVQKSLSQNLFAYELLRDREMVEVGDNFNLKVALNRQDEVNFVALDIVKKVRGGARYKDFEILVGNEAYLPIIRSAFDRYGIRHFVDKKEMLASQTKVKYLLSALAVALKNYRAEEVLDFVKNPIFALTLDESDGVGGFDKVFRFENYVLEYGINFNGFTKPFEYGDEATLKVVQVVRNALVDAIKIIDLQGTNPMSSFVAGARKFLDQCADQSALLTDKLTKISEYYKKCAEQVDHKLDAILTEIEKVLVGDGDLDKFTTVLASMLKTLKIALVPTFLDSVFVGDISSKFSGNGDLYVVGANAGDLPPDTEGGAVITPKDEELFEEAGINLYPTQRQKIKQNLYTITDILSRCRGKLTVSYALSGVEGELNPSSLVQQFKTLFKKNGQPLTAENISFDNLRASMISASDTGAMFVTDKSIKHNVLTYAVSGRASERDMDVYRTAYSFMTDGDKVAVGKLYSVPDRLETPQNIQKTSISRLERYFKCPYSYFLNYTLGLKRRDEGDITGLDNGTLLHAVFENFFNALKEGTVNGDNVETLATTTFDNVVKGDERLSRLAEKPDVKRLLQKLKKEGVRTCKDLYEISLRSLFRPTYLEAEFSKDGTFKPIALDVDGRTVELRGKIDRVDVYEDNFLVIDYKTYKSVDLTASEIYHGEKLQLYIYAQAITQNLDKKIAGVFYLPVYPSYVKEGVQRYKYKGQVSCNDALRLKMDSIVEVMPSEAIIPTPGNAQGKSSAYLDTDGFNARGAYAIEMAESGVRDISSGYIAPRPIENSCTKCEFVDVCKYKDKYPRTKYSVQNDVFLHYKDEPIDNDCLEQGSMVDDGTKEGK